MPSVTTVNLHLSLIVGAASTTLVTYTTAVLMIAGAAFVALQRYGVLPKGTIAESANLRAEAATHELSMRTSAFLALEKANAELLRQRSLEPLMARLEMQGQVLERVAQLVQNQTGLQDALLTKLTELNGALRSSTTAIEFLASQQVLVNQKGEPGAL